MAVLKRLYQGSPTTETTLFTATAGTTVIVKQVAVANTTSGPLWYYLSVVPTGGTAGVANRITYQLPVAAASVIRDDLFQVLAAGDFLSGIVQATGVVLTISGVELP